MTSTDLLDVVLVLGACTAVWGTRYARMRRDEIPYTPWKLRRAYRRNRLAFRRSLRR